MAKRIYDNPVRRAWWLIHIEAWQKSGASIAGYCRTHGLAVETFGRWRREIAAWTERKALKSQQRKKVWIRISKDKRRQATQAFWAMHVEAWIWSGMHLRDYAATHRLSPYSLKKWRNLIDSEEVVADWRTMLHPSALPLISTKIRPSAKEKAAAARLTAAIEAKAGPTKRATRRRWSTQEKIDLLVQAERHGSSVTAVAQKHGISTSVMFRWRDEFGMGKSKSAAIMPVRVVEEGDRNSDGAPCLLANLLPKPAGMIEVELADGRRVFAPVDVDPEAVRQEVASREVQP